MAQTLEHNKAVTNVYPVVPTLDNDMFIIRRLDDEPNDVGGLSADELKAEFDKAGEYVKDFINNELIPAVIASDLTEQTRSAAEAERVANEQERVNNEDTRVASELSRSLAEQERVNSESQRVVNEEIRTSAETIRENNEAQRIVNENARQDLETGYVAQASASAEAAKAAQLAAEKARDEAQSTVGGDFMAKGVYDPQRKAQDVFAYADKNLSAHNTNTAAHDDIRQAVNNAQNTADNKAAKSTIVTATLSASGWADGVYVLSVNGVTATSNQELLPAVDITAEQLEALQAANIQDGGQTAGNITLKAYGDVPTIDIPVRVIKRGD